eukprot:Hpha_TRINITY_DN19437_c0_g1::TRINITY_DN19437_c0_g1_i1::g.45740::m.45740
MERRPPLPPAGSLEPRVSQGVRNTRRLSTPSTGRTSSAGRGRLVRQLGLGRDGKRSLSPLTLEHNHMQRRRLDILARPASAATFADLSWDQDSAGALDTSQSRGDGEGMRRRLSGEIRELRRGCDQLLRTDALQG